AAEEDAVGAVRPPGGCAGRRLRPFAPIHAAVPRLARDRARPRAAVAGRTRRLLRLRGAGQRRGALGAPVAHWAIRLATTVPRAAPGTRPARQSCDRCRSCSGIPEVADGQWPARTDLSRLHRLPERPRLGRAGAL